MKSNKLNQFVIPVLLLTAGLSPAAIVTFESGQGYSLGSIGAVNGGDNAPHTGQQGWSRSTSNGTGAIITTTNSGEYVGGQALTGDTSTSTLTYIGAKRGIIEIAATTAISFSARVGNTSGNSVATGFAGDADSDGLWDATPDSGMQFGINAGAVFVREANFGAGLTLTGITNSNLTAGNWYGFNIMVGELIGGNRSISMSVRNLTTATTIDLNGASAGTAYEFSVTAAQFGVAPEDAVGGFVRVTQSNTNPRAAIDNLEFTAIPEPSTVFLTSLGVLALFRRRR